MGTHTDLYFGFVCTKKMFLGVLASSMPAAAIRFQSISQKAISSKITFIELQIVMILYRQSIGPVTIGSHDSRCSVLNIRHFLSELNIRSEYPFFKGGGDLFNDMG